MASLSQRRPSLWAVTMLVLVLALSLTACAGRAARGAQAPASQTTQQSSRGAQQTNSADTSLQSADQQIQNALQSLNSAASDANVNYSAQSTDTQP